MNKRLALAASEMGIALDAARIFTSGWAAAQYIAKRSDAAAVFLVGGDALRTEMEAVGAVESHQPDFVVAGIDLSLPLQRLSDAVVHVRNGAQLIVTNPDLTVPIEGGLRAGAGAVQAFIEAAAAAEATIIGKPQAGIFQQALMFLWVNKIASDSLPHTLTKVPCQCTKTAQPVLPMDSMYSPN